jgi:hypothetical protein
MRPNWTFALAVLLLALLLGAGCSGINASKSVSPLDFLIPGGFMRGLIQSPPPSAPANESVPATASVYAVAQVS